MYWSVLGCIVGVEYVAEWLVSWYAVDCHIAGHWSLKQICQDTILFHSQGHLPPLPCTATNPRLLLHLHPTSLPLLQIARIPNRCSSRFTESQSLCLFPRSRQSFVGLCLTSNRSTAAYAHGTGNGCRRSAFVARSSIRARPTHFVTVDFLWSDHYRFWCRTTSTGTRYSCNRAV
jgi:hypothetical protein